MGTGTVWFDFQGTPLPRRKDTIPRVIQGANTSPMLNNTKPWVVLVDVQGNMFCEQKGKEGSMQPRCLPGSQLVPVDCTSRCSFRGFEVVRPAAPPHPETLPVSCRGPEAVLWVGNPKGSVDFFQTRSDVAVGQKKGNPKMKPW